LAVEMRAVDGYETAIVPCAVESWFYDFVVPNAEEGFVFDSFCVWEDDEEVWNCS
jgi:hypothetical protein